MKHAILILAHKDFDQVRHLIEYFVRDCYVYVHIDKKAAITPEELHSIDSMPQVRAVYRKYKVHWGGFSILKTEMFLLRQVLKDGDCDYVHLISGQDYPIKPLDDFLKFFEEHKGKEFIRYANIPNPNWDHYTYARFKYFYPYDYINRSSKEALSISKEVIRWERKLGIKRRIPDYFDWLYGSTQWFSLTIKAINILLDYTKKHPSFYIRCHWTFAPEEFYIATVVVNLLPRLSISPTDLRYIRWKDENGNYPANLCMNHFHFLAEKNPFIFARKIERMFDGNTVVESIDKYLLTKDTNMKQRTGGWTNNYLGLYNFSETLAFRISSLCKALNVSSVLDMGCGAGYYVAYLRRKGIPIVGYDANPNTPQQSSLLLPDNDEPCGVADIIDPIEIDEPFDMVLCMELISSIPKELRIKAITNISKIVNKYLLITERCEGPDKKMSVCNYYGNYFKNFGFQRNDLATVFLNKSQIGTNMYTLFLERNICPHY